MEVSEKQLDDAIEDITDAICNVAYSVLEKEDAEMFLDELNEYFGQWNRLIGELKKGFAA